MDAYRYPFVLATRGIDAVGRVVGMGVADARGLDSGPGVRGDELSDLAYRAFDEREVYELALAGASSVIQRGHDGGDGVEGGHRVGESEG